MNMQKGLPKRKVKENVKSVRTERKLQTQDRSEEWIGENIQGKKFVHEMKALAINQCTSYGIQLKCATV